MIKLGKYNAGVYCGERFFSHLSWKRYGLYRRIRTGFSIGPVLFWRSTSS